VPSILFAVVLLTLGVIAEAQQPRKVPRIGFLSAASPSTNVPRREVFRQGLRELGYVEGKNIVVEQRYAEGKLDRLLPLAAELVRLKVDIILTAGGSRTRAARFGLYEPGDSSVWTRAPRAVVPRTPSAQSGVRGGRTDGPD
jgi:putative tryptophan/tyrosine transport system substrate-binding protein